MKKYLLPFLVLAILALLIYQSNFRHSFNDEVIGVVENVVYHEGNDIKQTSGYHSIYVSYKGHIYETRIRFGGRAIEELFKEMDKKHFLYAKITYKGGFADDAVLTEYGYCYDLSECEEITWVKVNTSD